MRVPAAASERLRWAVDRLGVRPGDRVLELGCGQGVAVSLIGRRLGDGGLVVGVDRSATMVAAALRRNAALVADGRARLVCAPVERADLGRERYDAVLAVRFPPLLRGRPEPILEVVRRHLAPGGAVHVVEHLPAGPSVHAQVEAIVRNLARGRFVADSVLVQESGGRAAVCVVARAGEGVAVGGGGARRLRALGANQRRGRDLNPRSA